MIGKGYDGQLIPHLRNYLSVGVASGVLAVVGVALFTRLLDQAAYGTFALFASTASIAGVFLELNFRGAVSRYYLEHTDDFRDFLRTTLLVLLGVAAAALVILVWLGRPIADALALPRPLFVAAIVAALVTIPWNLAWKYLTARKQSGRYGRLKLLRDALTIAAGVVGVLWWQGDRGWGRIIGTTAMLTAAGLVVLIWLLRESRGGRYEHRHLRYGLLFGIPLIPHALSGQLLVHFDRLVINDLLGASVTGLYAFAYDVSSAMNMVVIATTQALMPYFVELRHDEDHPMLERLTQRSSTIVVGAAVLIILASEEVGRLLGSAAYQDAIPVVPPLVLSYVALFFGTVYANYAFYRRATWIISGATLTAAAANVALNYALIPRYGYGIAAYTTLGAYLLLLGLHWGVARFVLREQTVPLRPMLWLFAGAAAVAVLHLGSMALLPYLPRLIFLKLPLAAVVGWRLWQARTA